MAMPICQPTSIQQSKVCMKNTKICDTSQDKFPAVIEKMSYCTH